MKRQLLSFLLVISAFSFQTAVCTAQTELTADQAKTLYKTTSKRRVSIHDPSVVYNEQNQRYYIFGSHKAGAYTTDMQNWTQANPTWNKDNSSAFTTPAVKTVKRGDKDVAFPAFNAMEWSARTDANYDINGNLWAPDVLWNPDMQKWCMYLSINGDAWHSSIVLLTADIITGPYIYQGPVVICGFQDSGHSYKDTDLELVIGTQSSLPTRYNVGNKWGNRWPHTIDPSAFYDENGKLWLVYGSWSGGIWMLELDETTGLRDYNIAYPSTNGTSDGVTSDPYFGKKIGGGYYVSGEGPYIEHIGQYYFLFVSYGGFAPDGGYEMRVFRSENPDGPYKDIYNRSAIFTSYALNYGAGNDNRGEKLMGAYNGWGFQTVGECAQGHNSAIAAPDGRTYLVYHTKFNDGTAGHQVRVHQLFLNKQGWLVASPFEYNGETLTDDDIAQGTACQRQHIAGTYQLLVHKYKMDHANFEEQTPVKITLNDDGTVSGAYTGAWSVDEGTNYISIRLASTTYNGVVFEQLMDQRSVKSIAFTATANSGVNIWGYKMHPQYELAWHLNNQKVPITNNTTVRRNYDLYGMRNDELDNVSLQWTSSQPDIISNYGRYNPNGLDDDTPITLAARLTCADYFWAQDYNVTAASLVNSQSQEEWKTGMLAHYGFDNGDMHNTLNTADEAQLQRNGTTALPTTVNGDPLRNGSVLHLNFGANGSESYAVMPNPLYGQALENGATISFYVKRTDNNLWDTLFGLVDGNARLYMTGNLYIGFNNNAGKWLDINHPTSVQPTQLTVNRWHLVTITFSRTASRTGGINIYVDGTKSTDRYNGELNGKTVTAKADFDYEAIVDHLAACQQLWFGRGSFWGSADAMYDHVMVHDHVLKTAEVLALYQMTNRVFDPATLRPDSGLVGDVNNDGEVGIGDIVAITNVMAGIETDTATISRADVNGDGEVGIGDIVAITNIMAGVSQ
jgi:arabinan endo-1,5-alpha-L-arabinosidase